MTTLAVTLPLARGALHLPRRDFVAARADDLTLNVSVVASDTTGAAATSLAAANTTLQLLIWGAAGWWDYGRGYPPARTAISTVDATIAGGTGGTATLVVARDTGLYWPERLGYTLQLDLGGTSRTTLCWGALHLPRVAA